MKKAILAVMLAVTTTAASAEIVMHRDPRCGCCMKWAAQIEAAFRDKVRVVDDDARPKLQAKLGITSQLASCHTASIGGYAFEGHVPVADMKRLLATKPKGVRVLAVGGMPAGSPGMEVPGGRKDRFDVVAFGVGKPYVFARH